MHTGHFLAQMLLGRQRETSRLRTLCLVAAVIVWLAFGTYLSWQVALSVQRLVYQIWFPGVPVFRTACAVFALYVVLSSGLWAFIYTKMTGEP